MKKGDTRERCMAAAAAAAGWLSVYICVCARAWGGVNI